MSCGWRAKWLRGYSGGRVCAEGKFLADSGATRPGSALFRGGTPRICSVSGRRPRLCSGSAVARAAHSDNPPAHLTIRLVPTTKETRHRRSGGSPVPHRPNAARCLHGVACPTPPSAACPNPTRPACPNPPGAVRPNPPNPARIACRNPARVGPILPIWNLLAAVRSHRAAVRRYPAAVRSDPTLLPRLTRRLRNRPWRPLERARRALGAGG